MSASAAKRPHRGTILERRGRILERQAYPGEQYVMRIECAEIAARAEAGAFVHLRCDPMLNMRRPMSIMRASASEGWFDILFKVHGQGTRLLAAREPGAELEVLGPIGCGFKADGYRRQLILIGGGVGIPPMIYLAEHIRKTAPEVSPLVLMGSEIPFPFTPRPSQIMCSYLPAEVIAAMPLLDDWGIVSRLASQQGYAGCYEGFVTELAREVITAVMREHQDIEIFACGPTPMLIAVQQLAASFDLRAELSLEEYMACAVGGCAGCAVKVSTDNGPAMKRVCVDGPVFEAKDVQFA